MDAALRLFTNGPSPPSNNDEVERLLSCPICLEMYQKPVVILPCQHNLCRKCANDMFQSRGTPMGSGGRFKCPTCRYEVMLDRHGVYGLQRNLLVENIIDMYKAEGNLKPYKKPEVLMCENHEEEKVNIFCTTCQKPTCSLCKVFGEHQECNVSPMDQVYKDHKKEMSDSIALLVAGNDKLQAIITKTEELSTKTEANGRTTQQNLCEEFDKLYAILEERKQNMLNKISTDVKERTQVLQELLKKYGERLEASSKLVEGSLALLEEQNLPQFLAISRKTIQSIQDATASSDMKQPPTNVDNMDDFDVDFTMQEMELVNLNFNEPDAGFHFSVEYEEEKKAASENASVQESNTNSSGFKAKLLLPNRSLDADDEGSNSTLSNQNEVEASAVIGILDEQDGAAIDSDVTSIGSLSKRRGSSSSYANLGSTSERYRSGRQSAYLPRSSSAASTTKPTSTGAYGGYESRRNYGDEESLWANW